MFAPDGRAEKECSRQAAVRAGIMMRLCGYTVFAPGVEEVGDKNELRLLTFSVYRPIIHSNQYSKR